VLLLNYKKNSIKFFIFSVVVCALFTSSTHVKANTLFDRFRYNFDKVQAHVGLASHKVLLRMRWSSVALAKSRFLSKIGWADKNYSSFEDFRMKHSLPKGVLTCNLYHKGNDIRRIINADRMRECICKNKLTHLHVPHKYLVEKKDGFHVYAQKIMSCKQPFPLSLKTVKQLAILSEETGYADYHSGNLFFDEKGDIYFIDTEDRSFGMYGKGWERKIALESLRRSLGWGDFWCQSDALQWLDEKVRTVKPGVSFLPTNIKFDPQDLSFQKVKTYYDSTFGRSGPSAIHYA